MVSFVLFYCLLTCFYCLLYLQKNLASEFNGVHSYYKSRDPVIEFLTIMNLFQYWRCYSAKCVVSCSLNLFSAFFDFAEKGVTNRPMIA